MPTKYIRPNITFKEASCSCCGEVPTDEYLDLVQELREEYGSRLNFTSMYRCSRYNKKIGGHRSSAHKVKIKDCDYGATDIKTGRYFNKFRYQIITLALRLGFNNIEVCNHHTHIAKVPSDHPMANRIQWGISK